MRNHKLNTIFELWEIVDYDDKVTNNVGIAKVLDNWQILEYKRLCLCVGNDEVGTSEPHYGDHQAGQGRGVKSIQADQEYRK